MYKLPDTLSKYLPHLQTLNVAFCEALTEIPPYLGFQLSELILDGCSGLKGIPFEIYSSGRMREEMRRSGVNCYGWYPGSDVKDQPTSFWVHLPTLVNICMTVVKRSKMTKRRSRAAFPVELWQRSQMDRNLCSFCHKVYFGPSFMERVTELHTAPGYQCRFHSRTCSLACDRAVLATHRTLIVLYTCSTKISRNNKIS